jgi:bifunctional enzyme CysN/CysC
MASSSTRILVCGSPGSGKSTLANVLETCGGSFVVAEIPSGPRAAGALLAAAPAADVALVVVDAVQGLDWESLRQLRLLSILGMRQVVVVSKLDVAEHAEERFRELADAVAVERSPAIPVSAFDGDSTAASGGIDWYAGETLRRRLEIVSAGSDQPAAQPFRLPVESVDPLGPVLGGISGTIASGSVAVGAVLRAQPSGASCTLTGITIGAESLDRATAGDAVALRIDSELAVARGDTLSPASEPAEVADQFEARIIWIGDEPLLAGRSYEITLGTRTLAGSVTTIKHRVSVETGEHIAATKLSRDEIGVCNVSMQEPVPFDPYEKNPVTGRFLLVDRETHETCGVGLIDFALRRAHNIHRQLMTVDRSAREALTGHRPCVVWLTGLSGAGKSTVANHVEVALNQRGCHTFLLDGDNVRHGLNRDLGFTDADRVENIRRVAEVSRLMLDAGLIVLVAFISPFRSERQLARERVGSGEFIEVYINTPLEVAEARDTKGLYGKARRGELKNFTGIDSAYEAPEAPELEIRTAEISATDAAKAIIACLEEQGVLSPSGRSLSARTE